MAKYDERFKQQVVDEYLAGDVGIRAVGARHGLDHATVRRWVASYEAHGKAGLRKKYSHYNAQFKRSVLEHMQREGLSCQQAGALFGIRNVASVAQWARQYHAGGLDALKPRRRGRAPMMKPEPVAPVPEQDAQDTRTRKDLLKEIEYLRAEVAYLKKLDALLQAKKQTAQKKKRK
jgi:transposase